MASRAPHRDIAPAHLQGILLHCRGHLDEAAATFEEARNALDNLPTTTRPFLPPLLLGFSIEPSPDPDGVLRIFFEETILLGRLVGVEQARAYVLRLDAPVVQRPKATEVVEELVQPRSVPVPAGELRNEERLVRDG